MVFGIHSCLPPVHPALSEDPPRDPTCCQQVVCFVARCKQPMAPVRLLVRCRRRDCCRSFGCFLLGLWGLLGWFGRVFVWYTVWVVWFIVGDMVDFRGMCSCGTFVFLFVCMLILNIRHCVAWSFSSSPQSSSTFLTRGGEDGLTFASKSLSLSLSGYLGDVNSCLAREGWPHAFDAAFELDLDCAFEGDKLAKSL